MKNRNQSVDVARGIAIICIVLGHLGNAKINRFVFTFHVPIFYLIAGYFTKYELSFRQFLWKKFRTLIVPYLISCLLLVVLAVIKQLIFHAGQDVGNVAVEWLKSSLYGAGDTYREPIYIHRIGAIWFLLALFWGSIFLYPLLGRNATVRLPVVWMLFLIGCWSRKVVWLPLSIQAGCCAMLYLYIGYLLQDGIQYFRQLTLECKAAWTVLAFLVWIAFIRDFKSFWLVHCDIGRGAIDIFGSLCGCYCVLLVSCLITRYFRYLRSFLAFLGRYSILVLCAHVLELEMIPWFDSIAALQATSPIRIFFWPTLLGGKFLWIFSLTWLGARSAHVRKLFGIK